MRGEVNVNPFKAECSELPNDNPALHDGAVWVSMNPVGRPRALWRPPPAEPRVESHESGPARESEPDPPPSPRAEPDAFQELVALLSRVALAAGSTRAAAVLPDFVCGRVVEVSALGQALCADLVESGHAIPSGAGIEMSARVGSTARAWRGVLSGQSEDLSACEETLDCWCADVVAALSGAPATSAAIRKELRRFGVAAFGLLVDAA